MTIYLVRHAKAGSRSGFDGDDEQRPLSKSGWKQAEAIARKLTRRAPTALVSSPYVRCRQTLEPLAGTTGLAIEIDHRLAEGGRFESALQLLAEVPDGAVLCSHGDVIPDTMTALHRRGCVFETPADWRKGTIWRLERGVEGTIERAAVWAPPE